MIQINFGPRLTLANSDAEMLVYYANTAIAHLWFGEHEYKALISAGARAGLELGNNIL